MDRCPRINAAVPSTNVMGSKISRPMFCDGANFDVRKVNTTKTVHVNTSAKPNGPVIIAQTV